MIEVLTEINELAEFINEAECEIKVMNLLVKRKLTKKQISEWIS